LATPDHNSVPYATFNTSGLGVGAYVAAGYKWGGPALGEAVVLTFSFPTGTAYHSVPYSDENEWSAWSPLSSAERAGARAALATWASFANVSFVEVGDTSMTVGEIRFAQSKTLGAEAGAHAYYPFDDPSAGDVWFNVSNYNEDGAGVPPGSYDFLTNLHEIGHALGLKHPFEDNPIAPAARDNYFYTIMSYTASPWSGHGDNYASFYPTTPMYYDLLAIEAIYGMHAYNTGNNAYRFYEGHKYWQAIQDTGGVDAISYVGKQNSSINLNQGSFSTLSDPIEFQRPGGSLTYSRATVTIGPHVVIENLFSGSGNDLLVGNKVDNIISGGAGNDTIKGLAGNDNLRGGLGNDTLIGGPGNDNFVFNTKPNSITNHDTVTDFNAAHDTFLLDNAAFASLGHAGALPADFFRAAAHAVDPDDYIVYYKAAGKLIYDDNGSGAGHEVLIASLTGRPVLTAHDFVVI
jgi:serralysin